MPPRPQPPSARSGATLQFPHRAPQSLASSPTAPTCNDAEVFLTPPLKSAIALLAVFIATASCPAAAPSTQPQPTAETEPRAAATQPASTEPAATESAQPPDNPFDQNLTGDWRGLRKQLADKGLTTNLNLTLDWTKNFRGGRDTAGSVTRYLVDAGLKLDTKPLLNLDGGTFFADLQYAQGPDVSAKLIGDAQGIDSLDGNPGEPHLNRTQLGQLWYQQFLPDSPIGQIRIKAGKMDANDEFDHSDNSQEFIHQSAASSATLFTLPTYPDNAFGLNLFYKPKDDWQLALGVYDGSLENGIRTGSRGISQISHNHGDVFLIAEIDKSWKLGPDQLPGKLGLGAWYSTNHFNKLNGGTDSGTGAPYALLDQTLWRANPKNDDDPRAISLFAMYGYADPAILNITHQFGAGATWTGILPNRPDDILGFQTQIAQFGNADHPQHELEIAYELFYKIQLYRGISLKPDLQYIASPGGQSARDALAFTLRLQISF